MSATPVLIMEAFPDFKEPGFDLEQYNQRFYNSNVVIRATSKSIQYDEHWGPLSIKCSLGGMEHYQSRGYKYTVDEDHFLIFNNGTTYSSWIDSDNEVRSFTLNISPSFARSAIRSTEQPLVQLDDPFENGKDYTFTEGLYANDDIISPVVKTMTQGSNEDQIDELFYALMEGLLLLQGQTDSIIRTIDQAKASTRAETFSRLLRARDFIHSSFRENISLDDIARVACMNKFYFLRQFRNVFNATPHRYLTERRLRHAARLIQTTDMPVHLVCQEVGFNDVSSFGKLYRRHYGLAPSGLRR